MSYQVGDKVTPNTPLSRYDGEIIQPGAVGTVIALIDHRTYGIHAVVSFPGFETTRTDDLSNAWDVTELDPAE